MPSAVLIISSTRIHVDPQEILRIQDTASALLQHGRAVDLLVPGVGEIIGGSQREERLDVLEKRIEECGLNKADYEWYLDLRRYGGTHHAGFGLGFERLVMYVTGMANIRDVLLFPRTTGSAEF